MSEDVEVFDPNAVSAKKDLSVIIPARNEEFLQNTIDSVLANIRGNTEIIVLLDGYWPEKGIPQHERLKIVHFNTSIGQRAATNFGVRISEAKFIMKLDAHCAVDEGFDVKLMADCEYNWTVIPRMYNLHVFDWRCNKCGHFWYQGPYPKKCDKCDNTTDFTKEIKFTPRFNRMSMFYRFDRNLHFQYWGAFKTRPEAQGDIADTMCNLGACWFMHRQRYWDIGGLDEEHGSWGQMGVEISCKSWLSGGRQVTNKKTWFSHLFRTQPGFGFPYPNPGSAVEKARERSRWLWQENNWKGAKFPLSHLLQKFYPIPDWDPEINPSLKRGMVYYTDNRPDENILSTIRLNLKKCSESCGAEIVSTSLSPIDLGRNIVLNLERGYLTMFKQILAGIEASSADILFMCEHDVLYHPCHFEFSPPRKDIFYYNENVRKLRFETGQTLFYYTKQTSGLCAYRELLLNHYRERVRRVSIEGFTRNMGFEPGTHSPPRGVDHFKAEAWFSKFPNIDIRHDKNLTKNRWDASEFRSKKACQGWLLIGPDDEVPGWGSGRKILKIFGKDL